MQQKLSHLVLCSSMHDVRRLRAFHAVAERRSFSEAALALGYAQSVVSHHVAALEQEFGLTLVDRATRPVGLTEAGERLREHAEMVLGQVATAEEEMRALAGLVKGTVRVGAFLTACMSFVPPTLARFEAAHPGVKIELEQLERATALRRLRAGELDIAVIWDEFEEDQAEERRKADGFESSFLGYDPYRIVLPIGHRLARRREVSLADLAGERFNAPSTATAQRYRAMLERLCAEAGFTPDVAFIVQDVTVGRAFVAAGVCVGLMSELAIQEPRPDVVVRPVGGLDPVRPIHATWLRGRQHPAIPAMARGLADAATARLGNRSADPRPRP
jgi:DNA-binding transcriptional LysR family regulator